MTLIVLLELVMFLIVFNNKYQQNTCSTNIVEINTNLSIGQS